MLGFLVEELPELELSTVDDIRYRRRKFLLLSAVFASYFESRSI